MTVLRRCIVLLSLWLVFHEQSASAQNMVPYLQVPTANSIYVSWQSTSGTDSTVRFGASADSLTNTAIAPASDSKTLASDFIWHSVSLTGLAPNTFYYYQAQTGSQTSQVFRFRTQPVLGSRTGHYRVLVAGDNQIQSPARWRSLLAAARTKIESLYGVPLEESINLVVNDGDQVDSGTMSQWQNTHFAMVNVVASNVAVQTAVGNHEGYSDTSYTNYTGLFRYDAQNYGGITSPGSPRYYSYQVDNIVFVVLDTEQNGTTQQAWVQQIVTSANSDPNVDFIVAVQHRPYTVELYVGDTSPWIHNTIMPILAQSPKMVLDFSGHHHLYARGQVKDYPIYHMIAGGSAWDEYWGQSTQQDMDDVQKTICNWTWSILDFDLAAKKLTVETYSEGGPLLGNGNQVGYYTSKHIDTFHRQPGLAAPASPALTAASPGTITLPYTFGGTAFSTTTAETLNTTEFQISPTATFSQLTKDVTRDFEDYYLDTGSPDYVPIDQNANVNINQYTIPTNGLANGNYYVRLRHRDSNAAWSAWSSAVPFAVTGSTGGTPALTLDKVQYPIVNASNPITANYKYGPGGSKDWVGIYKKGQTPGNVNSTTWSYVNTTNGNTLSTGTLSFTYALATNTEYFAAFFTNDGYTEIAPRIPFYVGPVPVLSAAQQAYAESDTVSIVYSNAPGVNGSDWIGVYKVGDSPGSQTAATQWHYLSTGAAGTVSFTGLAKGYYYANYFVNNGYTAIGNTVSFSVGSNISTALISKSNLAYAEPFSVSYANGPGNLKDYIGVFRANGNPGGSNPEDKLVYYIYPDPLGQPNATINITAALPSGSYKAALFINDSYTAASNFVNFTITDSRDFQVQVTATTSTSQQPGGGLHLSWPAQTGVDYRIETSTDLSNWTPVATQTGSGSGASVMTYDIQPTTGESRRFYRVRR